MMTCPSPSHLSEGVATWSPGPWEEQEQLVPFLRFYPPVPERRVSSPLCSQSSIASHDFSMAKALLCAPCVQLPAQGRTGTWLEPGHLTLRLEAVLLNWVTLLRTTLNAADSS